MDKFHCKNCDEFFELKTGPCYLVICPYCKKEVGSISDYGFGPIAPCSVYVGVEEFGEIIQKDGYTLISRKYGIEHRLNGGYKDLACYKDCARFVENWLTLHMIRHKEIKEHNKDRREKYTYDDLYVFALLYGAGYDEEDNYIEALREIYMSNPEDEDAIELRGMSVKNSVLHAFTLMNERNIDVPTFGKKLMRALSAYYKNTDLKSFAGNMYKLWGFLPYSFREDEPFMSLFRADDYLSYGNEKECRDILEKALNFYVSL